MRKVASDCIGQAFGLAGTSAIPAVVFVLLRAPGGVVSVCLPSLLRLVYIKGDWSVALRHTKKQ